MAPLIPLAGQLLVGLVVSTAVGAIQRALLPKPKATSAADNAVQEVAPAAEPDSPLAQSTDAGGPQIGIFGRRRVGGRVILNVKTGGKTYIVMVLAGSPVSAVNAIYINNLVVARNGSDQVTTAPWAASGHFSLTIKVYDGTQSAADSVLMAAFPGWTSQFKGSLQTYVRIVIDTSTDASFPALFQSGVPDFTFDVSGFKCYDPRDPAQDINTPSSWTFSENASLIEANYAIHELGRALPTSRIDWDSVAAAATVDDEPVTTLSGSTEPRYSASLVWQTDERHEDVHARIGAAHAGGMFINGQKYQMATGAFDEPSASIVPDDYADGGIQVSDVPSIDTIANGVRGQFVSPLNNYEMRDFPAYQDAAALAEDGGIEYWLTLTFPCVQRAGQAQRLARIAYNKARRGYDAAVATKVKHFDVIRNDVVAITDDLMALAAETFRVLSDAANGEDFTLDFKLQHEAADFYDWNAATDEKPMPLPVDINTSTTDPDIGGALQPPGFLAYDVDASSRVFNGVPLFHIQVKVDIAASPSARATHYDFELRFSPSLLQESTSVTVGTAANSLSPSVEFSDSSTPSLYVRGRSRVSSTGEVSDWSTTSLFSTTAFNGITNGATPYWVLPPPRAPQLNSSGAGTADLGLTAAPGVKSINLMLYENTTPDVNTASIIYDAANGNTTRTVTGPAGTFKYYWTRVKFDAGHLGPFSNTLVVAF